MNTAINREQWLQNAITLMRPWVEAAGYTLPATIHVSVGFPSKGALSRKVQRLGECWKHTVSADGSPQVYINPMMADPARVLDVLLHELGHAALPDAAHKRPFATFAEKVGLTGKPTATVATSELRAKLEQLIERELGPYPHPPLSPTLQDKKQTTRMLKAVCMNDSCAITEGDKVSRYTVRLTRLWLEKDGFGTPLCPSCETFLTVEDPGEKEE